MPRPSDAQPTGTAHLQCYCQPATTGETRPEDIKKQRQIFLSRFNWNASQLTTNGEAQVEHLLVKYHEIFARHPLDVAINTDFKVEP